MADPKTVKWLKRMNLLDHDIFVRPAARNDGCVEPLVLIDDLSKEAVQRLEKAGLPLAILIESSPANFHGWVRISDGPISQAQALRAARILAADFGGDPGAVGSRQFGRLAGFTNRKCPCLDHSSG
ncbi:DNA-primase RepB domain-containing protein [Bradyrhizobium sp. AZCC 2289]|uniref:DNA-primase RepB domain-containing protein n=1 Tax=Bradyrhizobium sp. AZCC 2289 TaxID=3117026 RepID=UPI002FF0DB3B